MKCIRILKNYCYFLGILLFLTQYVRGDMIAHYAFEGNALDASGNERHGSLHNSPVFVPGVNGQCIRIVGSGFTGTAGQHVTIPAVDFEGLDAFSITMWVKEEGMTDYMGEGYVFFGDHVVNEYVGFGHFSDTLQFSVGYGAENRLNLPYNYDQHLNQWTHYALTYDGELRGILTEKSSVRLMQSWLSDQATPVLVFIGL